MIDPSINVTKTGPAGELSASSERGVFVGPYRLIRPIGSGGMSDVHLAQRDDGQYSKLVALKRIRGASGAKQRERFWAERQILAQLDHPNIAALLDGGETAEGELYVAMEYVDGEPLLDYCQRHQLPVEKRLRLLLQVCGAVRHAHQKLIVHRDLKPSNILVTADGTVKLIDFGIAKALLPDFHDLPPLETQAGDLMLTPLYASPEQVLGERVTTASDVYSLGVVAFELLTGALPYTGTLQGAALSEAIRQQEPRTLRSAVAADQSKLRSRLAGDLETIVAMALRKEPARRYGSVEQFAADIERHLNGFPVSARPDTAAYRVSRFVGRHRGWVAGAAAVAVLLAVSSAINYQTARRAERERDTARTVASFLESIFEAPNPGVASGREVTARELLDRGAERIEKDLRDQPEAQARLLMTIALTYKDLGHLDRSLALYDQAIALRKGLYGANHPDVAEAMRNKGRVLQVQGRYAESEQQLREALEIQRRTLPEGNREALKTMSALGLVLQRRGQLNESPAPLKPALDALTGQGEAETGSTDDLFEETMSTYSLVLSDLGRMDEAEQARRTIMKLDLKRYGANHAYYAMDLATVGSMLRERDALTEAEPLLRQALELSRKIEEPGSPALLHTMQYLAICLQKMGRLEEAEQLWNELRPQRIKSMGASNRFVATDWLMWGDLLRRKGDLAGAEAAIRKGIEIRNAALKPGHPSHSGSHAILARVLQQKGDLAAAEREFRVSYDIIRATHGDSNPRTSALAQLDLGNILWKLGRNAEAEPLLRQSFGARKHLPASDAQRRDSALALGQFLSATGRAAEGTALVSQAARR